MHTLCIVLFVLFQWDDIAINRRENALKLYNMVHCAKDYGPVISLKFDGLS